MTERNLNEDTATIQIVSFNVGRKMDDLSVTCRLLRRFGLRGVSGALICALSCGSALPSAGCIATVLRLERPHPMSLDEYLGCQ